MKEALVLLLLFLASPLSAEGEGKPASTVVEHKDPAFSFVVPEGYATLPENSLADPEGLDVLYGYARAVDGKARGIFAIVKLKEEMEQIVLVPEALGDELRKLHPSIFREQWNTLDLYCLRILTEERGITVVRLMVFVPVKGCGIRMEFMAPITFEPTLIKTLRGTLKSLKAETNWADTAPGQPNETRKPPTKSPAESAPSAATQPAATGEVQNPNPNAPPSENSIPIWLAVTAGGALALIAVVLTIVFVRKPREQPLLIRRAPLPKFAKPREPTPHGPNPEPPPSAEPAQPQDAGSIGGNEHAEWKPKEPSAPTGDPPASPSH